jgi:hypothetical protein
MKKGYTYGLHVHAQYTYHADAGIVGTPQALTALRDAINYALKFREAEIRTFASDGEGYTLTVQRVTDQEFDADKPDYLFLMRPVPA